MLHQVDVSFELYYDARNHKIKNCNLDSWFYEALFVSDRKIVFHRKMLIIIQLIELIICTFITFFYSVWKVSQQFRMLAQSPSWCVVFSLGVDVCACTGRRALNWPGTQKQLIHTAVENKP